MVKRNTSSAKVAASDLPAEEAPSAPTAGARFRPFDPLLMERLD